MNFKEWIINESILSHAEALYQKFIDDEIDLEELEPDIINLVQKWYDKHEFEFNYDAFENEVLARVAIADGDTLKEILFQTSRLFEKQNKRVGVKLDDEEGGEQHDKAADFLKKTLTPKKVLAPVGKPMVAVSAKPASKPVIVAAVPKPISAPVKPKPERLSPDSFYAWQQRFDFDPKQKKLFRF